jgi:MerR family transcriptional regulator, redox-sensitive transcriptional activator SoxR
MKFEIGEVARRAGVRASAVRYYEKQGLISPERGNGGRRVFTSEAVERIALIRYAKGLGFSLMDIRKLLTGFADETPAGVRWSELAAVKLVEVEALMKRVEGMRAGLQRISGCRCRDLEQCAHAIASTRCDS